ncbi:sphingomyelin phosphodiesterase [Streptomyces sp. 2333.5]|uniref:sphingomyelin phosphodiesterase n=1 Tax=unclassified Streptomyces TaxID=2593676 RepID=UPI00089728CF|nr:MULTISPECIES: sphingomyelin phosphodiesterase [unclassified Streptomyces]PJJ05637.1 sphingomyelin phosphodiesterase [Streptomyces sp. 2333.5]SEE80888.1 sphingomyelin phosphodiesterase [Streptomyces sp. 2314.4]SEF01949.1 sphingomyelin phosphodiesterase [Streptomyces sp. 2112.2]
MPHSPLRTSRIAALTAALAAVTVAATPSASAAAVPHLKVLSYNTFLMSKTLYPNWGQDHRAQAIAAADFFQGNDVVVLQEAFDNSASDALKSRAAAQYPHQTPVVGRSRSGWDATGGSYSATTPEDGGVTLLSKWPIVHKEQYIYKDACGSDYFSNKGFVYAVLDVNGTKVHVVGTHTQSTDSGCKAGEAAADRAKQLKEVDAFLDAKNIPADEEVMVAGDLNIDSHGDEYPALLSNADLAPADSRTGHPYSFDTQENSIAKFRYPNDPREDLDYVLHRNGHARPAGWQNTVVKEESAPWTVSSWGKDYTYTNLSDHYPLIGG